MTCRGDPEKQTPRVGFFGLLGADNLGNDASFETVLRHLQRLNRDVSVDAMCIGPEQLHRSYGIEAIPLHWSAKFEGRVPRLPLLALKVMGKMLDAARTLTWVRRHDVVIVAGMGVMEASLPLRATGMPWALFLLGAAGRLTGTDVALVSVGATQINQRPTRTLFNWAARLASYRSYRDATSRDAMQARGIDTSGDAVYSDLVFGLAAPASEVNDSNLIAVGVMAYRGSNDDRSEAEDIYARYTTAMKFFVRWLLDEGRRVLLFWGDGVDLPTAREILADAQTDTSGVRGGHILTCSCSSLGEVMEKLGPVGVVVATRYHNVLAGLKLAKPTISVGYSSKHHSLMGEMGMSDFSLSARELDGRQLVAAFKDLEHRSAEVRADLMLRGIERRRAVDDQLSTLTARFLSPGPRDHPVRPEPNPLNHSSPATAGIDF